VTSRKTDITTRRDPESKTTEARMRPFTSVLLAGLLIVPLVILALRLYQVPFPHERWFMTWLSLVLFGVFGPLIALAVGYKVAERRLPFVVWHVAATVHLFAVAISLGMQVGWDRPDTDPWYLRLRDDAAAPGSRVFIAYMIGAAAVCGSWLLYRINAFRSATNSGGDGSGDSWSELLKMPQGASVRRGSIVVDDVATQAEIDHPGVPIADLRAKLPALEEAAGAIRGRSSIVGGERGGTSTVRMVHTDPHKEWKPWPGLSFPGGSYSWPIRTSYYSDGQVQWYSFCRTPKGFRSELCPGFRSPNDVFKGSQGMTGAGKSGEAAIETAEVLSRRNVVVAYLDLAKLLQNAGWCMDFLTLAVGNSGQSRLFWRGMRMLGEYRSRVLGEHRNFNDEAAEATGLPWVHIFADEFDVVKNSADVKWLATKGRSLGFRLSFALPRATAAGMDSDVRGAVGMWAQFGISQDYDKGFVLSAETMAAGANPEAFGARLPGVHYLDQAPGIPEQRYPVDCRSYETHDDYGDLRRAVEAARATFTPATFTPGEVEVLTKAGVWQACRPSVVRAGRLGMVDDDAPAAAALPVQPPAQAGGDGFDLGLPDDEQAALARARGAEARNTGARPGAASPKGTSMPPVDFDTDTNGHHDTGDDDLDALLDESRQLADLSEFRDENGRLPEHDDPLPDYSDGDIDDLPTGKPEPRDRAHAIAEFDAALIRMAQRGVTRFRNADLIAEMTVEADESMISKRFTALCDDEALTPPGIVIEREGRGQFLLTRVSPDAGVHGA
jgi:hypothetical protein